MTRRTTRAVLAGLALLILAMLVSPSSARAACAAPAGDAGDLGYFSDQKVFVYCDGTTWHAMNPRPGTGSGGCANPTMSDGRLGYNADYRVLTGCAGSEHVPMGKIGGKFAWKQVSAGGGHSCGIQSDDSLWCWGANNLGQLGDNSTTGRSVPST